jgi:hypothetical protein
LKQHPNVDLLKDWFHAVLVKHDYSVIVSAAELRSKADG